MDQWNRELPLCERHHHNGDGLLSDLYFCTFEQKFDERRAQVRRSHHSAGHESGADALNKVKEGMAAGDGAQLPATVAVSRSVDKALEEAAASGALNLSNRKLKEFPRSAKNYDLSDITHAGLFAFPPLHSFFTFNF